MPACLSWKWLSAAVRPSRSKPSRSRGLTDDDGEQSVELAVTEPAPWPARANPALLPHPHNPSLISRSQAHNAAFNKNHQQASSSSATRRSRKSAEKAACSRRPSCNDDEVHLMSRLTGVAGKLARVDEVLRFTATLFRFALDAPPVRSPS
jgi:hypothetical protein